MKIPSLLGGMTTIIIIRPEFPTLYENSQVIRKAQVAGCSAQQLFFTTLKKIYNVEKDGQSVPRHGRHDDFVPQPFFENNGMQDPPLSFVHDKKFAEERAMLKNYTVPLIQLDISKVMMIVCHGSSNTVPKEQLTNRPNLIELASGCDIKTKIRSFVGKKDKISLEFYLNLIRRNEESGESALWQQYKDSGRTDIFHICQGTIDPNSDEIRKLNGLHLWVNNIFFVCFDLK